MLGNINKCALIALLFGCVIASVASAQNPTATPRPTTAAATASSASFVGKPAIRWAIPRRYWTNTRKSVWLGGLEGHVTVIEFFRINCSHCQEAAPSRQALYRKYQKQGLKMVGFQSPGVINDPTNTENNWKQVQRTVRQWQLSYPIAFDQKRHYFDKYHGSWYPTILVLDRKGIIRFQQTGYSPEKAKLLEQFVAQALKSDS